MHAYAARTYTACILKTVLPLQALGALPGLRRLSMTRMALKQRQMDAVLHAVAGATGLTALSLAYVHASNSDAKPAAAARHLPGLGALARSCVHLRELDLSGNALGCSEAALAELAGALREGGLERLEVLDLRENGIDGAQLAGVLLPALSAARALRVLDVRPAVICERGNRVCVYGGDWSQHLHCEAHLVPSAACPQPPLARGPAPAAVGQGGIQSTDMKTAAAVARGRRAGSGPMTRPDGGRHCVLMTSECDVCRDLLRRAWVCGGG